MRRMKLPFWGSAFVAAATLVYPVAAQQISVTAKQQMTDILRIKRSLNASQRKMTSRLVLASLKARHQMPTGLSSSLLEGAAADGAGSVVVDMKVLSIKAAEQRVLAAGGTVLESSVRNGMMRARVPATSLEMIAGSAAVRSMKTPASARTNSIVPEASVFASPTVPTSVLWDQRREAWKRDAQAALPVLTASGSSPVLYPHLTSLLRPFRVVPFIGSITSQGYVTHRANQAIGMGYDGTGVRVGVLSDSATPDRVAALIASGDLPPDVTIVPGQSGASNGSNEGTAMMEIVHDLAPGAKLFFATAFTSESSFADNIRTLRSTYHCDIIMDDISYFDEPAFQDGIVADAINDVTADGALYFSAAANSGNLTSGTSGTWEGDFQAGADPGTVIDQYEGGPVIAHNFGTAANPQGYNTLTGGTTIVNLFWSDPLAGSGNDYDLFVLDSTNSNVLAYSTNVQDGTQDPIEQAYLATGFPAGSNIFVIQYSATTRALHIDTERGRLAIGTAGATFGHNAGLNSVSVAATAWNSGRRGIQPFTTANRTESFSSDGPRTIFYQPDGTAITPGNYLFATNGGVVLQKPDLTAADGVFTKTPGFLPFFGTSAATPHAAAIAALVKSANANLTNAQIKQIMIDTALDNMAPGPDRDAGYGITMALPAVQAALLVH